MLTKNISFKNFKVRKNTKKIKNDLKLLIKENNSIIKSLSPYYKNNYSKKLISKLKKNKDIRVIGMGGSILGTEAIYDFLKDKNKTNTNKSLEKSILKELNKN